MSKPEQLIALIAAGNKLAFRQFYNLFSEKVYNTALSYTHNVQDAEEITQDVFTTLFLKSSSFKGNSKVNTWVYRITVNKSLNFIQSRNRKTIQDQVDENTPLRHFDHPGIVLENKEKARILFAAIDTLSESQKTAFILAYIEGLSRKEMAEIMLLSVKAIESLLQRAKSNLRAKLINFK